MLFRLEAFVHPGLERGSGSRRGIRPQSVVDLIGPLERRGLIKRREAPEHRRILRITLSAAGEQLFARALPSSRADSKTSC